MDDNRKTPTKGEYGVTEKYERKNYDSQKAKTDFRDSKFGDKQTTYGPNGELLHKHSAPTKNKYGSVHASKHAAQVDHIDPLENIHSRHKGNPYLKDSDIKEISNRESNLQLLNAKANASKQSHSEYSMGLKEKNAGRVVKGGIAQLQTDVLLSAKTVKNVGEIGVQGATNALSSATISLTVCGVDALVRAANGDITPQEVTQEIATMGASIAVTGAGSDVANVGLCRVLEKSNVELLKKFSNSNAVGDIILVASNIAKSASRFYEGKIDAEAFGNQLLTDVFATVKDIILSKELIKLLGVSSGGTAIAVMVINVACSHLKAAAEEILTERGENEQIRDFANKTSREMIRQREKLNSLLEKSHREWTEQMLRTFETISDGMVSNDMGKMNGGLRQLTKDCKRPVALYESGDEALTALLAMRNGTATHTLLTQQLKR